MKSWLWMGAVALVGCTGSSSTGPVGPFNFDREIDGSGVDYNDTEAVKTFVGDKFDSFDPVFCKGADETLFVVWGEKRYVLGEDGEALVDQYGDKQIDGFIDVWFTRSPDGGTTWLSPVQVKQGVGDASGIHMDCDGDRVFVVWEDNRDSETLYQNIYLNYSLDGGDSWQEEDTRIDDDEKGYYISLGPKVAIYEGRVHVVWYDQVNGAPDIYMSTSINNGKKFQPQQIIGAILEPAEGEDGAGSAWNGNPQLKVDGNGVIYVLWESTRNGKQDLFLATSTSGGDSFNPKRRIDTGDERGSHYSFAPRFDVTAEAAYVVWHDDRSGENRDVFMNYSADAGATWLDEAVRVDSGDAPGFSESLNPDVDVVGNQAHIVWQDNRERAYDIYYRVATAGAFDAPEIRVENDQAGAANSTFPRIARSADATAVVFSDYRNATTEFNDLYYNYTDPDAVENTDRDEDGWWDEDLLVTSAPEGKTFTQGHQPLVVGADLLNVWVDGRNGSLDVFFSRTALGDEMENLSIYAQQR